jgi:hypothetical protein
MQDSSHAGNIARCSQGYHSHSLQICGYDVIRMENEKEMEKVSE